MSEGSFFWEVALGQRINCSLSFDTIKLAIYDVFRRRESTSDLYESHEALW